MIQTAKHVHTENPDGGPEFGGAPRQRHWSADFSRLTVPENPTGTPALKTILSRHPLQTQVLRTEPTRPHVQLGQVQAEPSSDSLPTPQIEQALQKAAAKMGANAVVIVADRTQTMGAVVTGPLWARQVDTISGRVIVGVAIRYTGP
jgi:hypothetical protein